jgi:dTDP-4-amino-4,6-dideoxygalactose transaminase
MINVTQSFIPEKELFDTYLNRAWESKLLTNNGQLVVLLKKRIKDFLALDNIILTNNGTTPLQIALRQLGSGYEVITTPFSYIATSAAIVWQNCQPVFVDIDPDFLTIDETLIEAAITPKTKAIMATHVFGNPCNIESIEKIARKYNLLVIYDGAHAFGVKYKGESVFKYGDISSCSFHATKIFHTAEGGAIFCSNKELFKKLDYSINFGHHGQYDYHGLGINAKISELHAAMGLSVLPSMNRIFSNRNGIIQHYNELLEWDFIRKIKIREHTEWNYSYYPIIFNEESDLLRVLDELGKLAIFPRRYFNPSLNTVSYLKGQSMPVSESISKRILCLPLYFELSLEVVRTICKVLNSVVKADEKNYLGGV